MSIFTNQIFSQNPHILANLSRLHSLVSAIFIPKSQFFFINITYSKNLSFITSPHQPVILLFSIHPKIMEASADIIFAFRGSSEWLAQRNLNTYICPVCLTTSPTNFFAQKDPDFPNMGNPDLFKSLPLKFLLKVCFEIFNFNSFLLHCITVTNSNCSVFF